MVRPSSTPRFFGSFTWNVPLLGTTDSVEQTRYGPDLLTSDTCDPCTHQMGKTAILLRPCNANDGNMLTLACTSKLRSDNQSGRQIFDSESFAQCLKP